jgi:hypothetical protein
MQKNKQKQHLTIPVDLISVSLLVHNICWK